MKIDEIRNLLSLGEREKVDLKTNLSVDIVGPNLCAFLNTKSGYILCGIDDKGNPVGIDPGSDILKIEQELRKCISPQAFFSVEEVILENKKIAVIEVPIGKDTPYSFNDSVYIRVGEKTVKAPIDSIRDMIMRKEIQPERWERRFSTADIDNDLDTNEVTKTFQTIKRVGRYDLKDTDDFRISLEELALIKYGRLTNAGDVLLTKNPAIRYPQIRVKAYRYNLDKTDSEYQDIKTFEGPLLQILEDAYHFIIRNTQTISKFNKDDLSRKDSPIYPTDAIREALVNAFAHRDYANYTGEISIHIYPRKLEIKNSGQLPEGLLIDKHIKGRISILQNPDIANILYLQGRMEKIGRGGLMILKACSDSGLPAPVWQSDEATGVVLTFFTTEATPQVTPEDAPQVEKEATKEVKRLLNLIHNEMTSKQMQNELGLSDEKNFRFAYLVPALEQGFIEMTKPDTPTSPAQKYKLTKKGLLIQNQL
jgi:ATP-dependent DNA helicase RecG